MAPIRLALIGLASSDRTSWASNAHLPYLLSPRGRERYQIVALCNSSVESARRAIQTYNLPSETRAYGDPDALAEDPNVDLVVCSTRVDIHYKTVLPSLKAKKDLFVEWPIAHNIASVHELAEVAKASGSRTMVGLQGRFAPVMVRIRELLDEGRIGKILSSQFQAIDSALGKDSLPAELEYFTKRDIGGNMYTIFFAHLWDQIQSIIGEVQDPVTHLQTQYPRIDLRNEKMHIVDTVTSDVPDLIVVTGSLRPSQVAVPGATLAGSFRVGKPLDDEHSLTWSIYGESGVIRLTAGSTLLQARGYKNPVILKIHDYASNKTETVDWNWNEWQQELPLLARSVGSLYEVFSCKEKHPYLPTFEDAVGRHDQLEQMGESTGGSSSIPRLGKLERQ
ncbi:Galactose/lactose metabolism regulatory protein GAL80 [Paramyrothecium foliicola]|nr:Galactose/lactose metabolism regulatory protein GAL80 [Paramyrothecium foliicola]